MFTKYKYVLAILLFCGCINAQSSPIRITFYYDDEASTKKYDKEDIINIFNNVLIKKIPKIYDECEFVPFSRTRPNLDKLINKIIQSQQEYGNTLESGLDSITNTKDPDIVLVGSLWGDSDYLTIDIKPIFLREKMDCKILGAKIYKSLELETAIDEYISTFFYLPIKPILKYIIYNGDFSQSSRNSISIVYDSSSYSLDDIFFVQFEAKEIDESKYINFHANQIDDASFDLLPANDLLSGSGYSGVNNSINLPTSIPGYYLFKLTSLKEGEKSKSYFGVYKISNVIEIGFAFGVVLKPDQIYAQIPIDNYIYFVDPKVEYSTQGELKVRYSNSFVSIGAFNVKSSYQMFIRVGKEIPIYHILFNSFHLSPWIGYYNFDYNATLSTFYKNERTYSIQPRLKYGLLDVGVSLNSNYLVSLWGFNFSISLSLDLELAGKVLFKENISSLKLPLSLGLTYAIFTY